MSNPSLEISQLFSTLPAPHPNFSKAFAFSIHKAGSSLMMSLLTQYCKAINFPSINISEVMFNEGIFDRDWFQLTELREVINEGYLHLGFRALPEILNPNSEHMVVNPRDYRACLLVRDPRDCLVSQYYSMGRSEDSSHVSPKKNTEAWLEFCRKQATNTIDDYALVNCEWLFTKFENYLAVVINNPNIRVFRYEDIYFDKLSFLIDMLEWFSIPIDQTVVEAVAKQNDIRPDEEDWSKHIRKGTPGDYREKLSAETTSKLTTYFAELMANYGYSLVS
ncbi:Sulfotransferase domain superfamily [Synechococcus sp. PCC 7335]|uniref:sulfotransferase domain-containing protein n=1 Tax=Synechococcus sp. (strain ATCC 29403 / PCC 7335) TaxID=91464 RepID=UPI00017ED273|nr:sulfotransferase domain-containing protein [Synechococcus sp. PCC 7335]EDX86885.1 Sulfotransferase domain superfamily [Synechococcus sp. PCC 7335]